MSSCKFRATIFVLAMAACAPIKRLPTVPNENLDAFLSLLASGSLEGEHLLWLDAANQSELAPIVMLTGIHCIDPSREESYHQLQFQLASPGRTSRVVAYVTLTPATSMFHPPSSVFELFHGRNVTQFHVWEEGTNHQQGTVVAYRSREPLPGCGVADGIIPASR